MEKQKNIEQDILQRSSLKENPYTLPKGYFAMVEDSVHKRIHKEEEPEKRWITILKPAVMLAVTFGVIFGLGYGAMYVTGTTQQKSNDLIVMDESAVQQDTTSYNSETLFETMRSAALLDFLTDPENDDIATTSDSALESHKDNIEQYLIESNVSLITLASLE